MGGGPDLKQEHMLAILPFAEPTAIFDRIRKNHPNIKISFHSVTFAETVWKGLKEVPKGKHRLASATINWHACNVHTNVIDGYSPNRV